MDKNIVSCLYLDILFIKSLKFTGYNHSVTGCGSQRRHVVVTQQKNLSRQRDPHPQIEFDFVEKHIH